MLIQLDKVLNAHVYNLKLKEDAPNGAILEKGKYVDYDAYEAGKVADVDGEILMTVNAFLDETGLEDAISLEQLEIPRIKLIDESDTFNTKSMIKVNVKMGLEGFDADCFEAVASLPLGFNLVLANYNLH